MTKKIYVYKMGQNLPQQYQLDREYVMYQPLPIMLVIVLDKYLLHHCT